MSHINHRRKLPKRRDPIARDLLQPKYRMRVEARKPKYKTSFDENT